MRAAKMSAFGGISVDVHAALPPSVPPPPPAPPNLVMVPTQNWTHLIVNPLFGWTLTGKWSMLSVTTEGSATLLWQHDWGPLQPHIPIPAPVLLSPSVVLLLMGSTAKYYLPSFSVQQPQDGAIATGGATPVAVCYPAFFALMETCADIGTVGFCLPAPGVCFQAMTTRWVGFSWGDLAAGLIGVAGDSLAAFVSSKFGGSLFPGLKDDQLLGGLASSAVNIVGGLVANWPGSMAAVVGGGLVAGADATVRGRMRPSTFGGLGAVFGAPVIGWLAGQGANLAAGAGGSTPADAAPGWERAPQQ